MKKVIGKWKFHYETRTVFSSVGNYRPVGIRKVRVNHPYGWIGLNGLSFVTSVKNPKSRLARLVNYLRENVGRDVSKVEILNQVFSDGKVNGGKTFTSDNRGWGACLFVGGRHCGFLKYYRVGRNGYWTLGENAEEVVK